jgi:predicted kinase
MEGVIFAGLQASGKSTFYQERFFNTHVRINLDMLKTRNREKQFLQVCLQTQQPFVVDNTNPTKEDRQKYIEAAKAAGFRVVGYYFQSQVEECKRRNENRPDGQQVPLAGVLGTYNRLEIPSLDEGFDELHYVKIGADNSFIVEEWSNEV